MTDDTTLQPRKLIGYGWVPDLPDQRDCLFRVSHRQPVALPPLVDLTDKLPPVFDQGQLGSCVGNSTGLMHAHVYGLPPRSRLAIYYGARRLEGTVKQDCGCQIRDAIKVLAKIGAGAEALWPYDISKFAKPPSRAETNDGRKHTAVSYSRLQTREDFRECLAAGFPFAIGFTVYQNFETAQMGRVGVLALPDKEAKALGGHAVLVAGYDTAFRSSAWGKEAVAALGQDAVPDDVYIVRNSWGEGWGHGGNFAVDARYFENPNLADDAWTLRP